MCKNEDVKQTDINSLFENAPVWCPFCKQKSYVKEIVDHSCPKCNTKFPDVMCG